MILLPAYGKQAGKIAFRQRFWHLGVDNPRTVLRVVHAAARQAFLTRPHG
jgi:hypothetical protein